MTNPPHPTTAQIRRLLNTAFDDPGLEAFCQDYFPAVYDRFSRGMRKDEKITLLPDHCRRTSGGLEALQQAVYSEHEASGSQRDEFKALTERKFFPCKTLFYHINFVALLYITNFEASATGVQICLNK